MGGIYGISKAAKANEEGKYELAIEEATRAIALDEDDPEAPCERAFALSQLGRYAEAVADLELAIRLDEEEDMLDDTTVDDALFSALLGDAKELARTAVSAGAARLGRYAEILPKGGHLKDAREWARRLTGELKTTDIVKARLGD